MKKAKYEYDNTKNENKKHKIENPALYNDCYLHIADVNCPQPKKRRRCPA